jgi:hypothetical protein
MKFFIQSIALEVKGQYKAYVDSEADRSRFQAAGIMKDKLIKKKQPVID